MVSRVEFLSELVELRYPMRLPFVPRPQKSIGNDIDPTGHHVSEDFKGSRLYAAVMFELKYPCQFRAVFLWYVFFAVFAEVQKFTGESLGEVDDPESLET